MKKTIEIGHKKRTLYLKDHIVYSRTSDMMGNVVNLEMSVMLWNGDSELRQVVRENDPREDHTPKPAILWVPGGGWRGEDKSLYFAEMADFANAGFVMAAINYRTSSQGHFPAQVIDVETAIRFLRANADKYEIDPSRIGIMGHSAGGYLAVFAAMNLDGFESDEWRGYSSKVGAAVDIYGAVNILGNMEAEEKKFSDPNFRWHSLEETHGGALLGGDPGTMKQRALEASPISYVNAGMAPIQIYHGNNDPVIPIEVSSDILYQKIEDAGLDDRVEYYIVQNAGHGTREFFQTETKQRMIDFFNFYLKESNGGNEIQRSKTASGIGADV